MQRSPPSLSLVIPVGPHDDEALANLLASIDRQAFPKESLEVLLQYEGNSEEARAEGIRQATGDIIGCLDADNQLLGFEFLQHMVAAALQSDVCGVYPSHYAWFADDAPLNRLFALLGGNDPLALFLGKADRRSWLVAPRTERVVFRGSVPTLGSNGFFVKRECVQPYWWAWRSSHIDGCQVMADHGHGTYTVVDTVIWHRTGLTLGSWLKKRYTYAVTLGLRPRRWRLVATVGDWLKCGLFLLLSLCLLPSLWVSGVGYRRHRDHSWWLLPLAAAGLACVYTVALAQHLLGRVWSFALRVLRHMKLYDRVSYAKLFKTLR